MSKKKHERSFLSASAVCPYYMWETCGAIVCRGFLPRSNVKLTFDTQTRRKAYRSAFCERRWALCKIAQALTAAGEERKDVRKEPRETSEEQKNGDKK